MSERTQDYQSELPSQHFELNDEYLDQSEIEAKVNLQERTKELGAITRANELFTGEIKPIKPIIQTYADEIEAWFQYPRVTEAKIRVGDHVVTSTGYKETSHPIKHTDKTEDGTVISVEVVYTEKRPEEDDGPWIDEEHDLLDSILGFMVAYVNKKERREALEKELKRKQEVASEVESGVTEIKDVSEDVAETTDEISDHARESANSMQTVSEEIADMSATVEEIASTSEEVAATSQSAKDLAEDGASEATEAISVMNRIDDSTEEVSNDVESLQEQIEEIDEIVEVINDIADQTNILALNASIEAARAGEAGSGFAVVADEVKKLAEDTEQAVEEIEESITTIQDQANETVEDMNKTSDRIDSGVETIEGAVKTFREIADEVEETNVGVQEISEATDTQAESLQEAAAMIDDVGDIADETAGQAKDAAHETQQQTTALAEVSAGITTLDERSAALDQLTDSYETGSTNTTVETHQTHIEFWHAMGGDKGVLLESLIKEFESQHDDIRITATSKGSYRGTLEATMSAAEKGSPPALAQIYEIGTAKALNSGAFTPVENVIPSSTNLTNYLDPVLDYYRTDGTLNSMPFNSSVPVLCINRDAFLEAGLDPDNPPETFKEITNTAEQLVQSGATETGITFANYSWFVEQWFASAGQELVNNDNGRSAAPTTTHLVSDAGTNLYSWWTTLDNTGLYENPGMEARGKAKELFHAGTAGMLIGSSSSVNSITSDSDFGVSVSSFPSDGERVGLIVGGASLWVSDNVSQAKQEAAGKFIAWMTDPEQQARWHRETGYLPVNGDTVDKLEVDGWFGENPGHKVAIDQLLGSPSTPATNGARIETFNTVRTLIAEAYEDIRDGDTEEELGKLNERIELQLTR